MKTLISKLRLFLILPLMTFGASATLAAEKLDTLRFGLLPTEDALEVVKQFQGIADYVGKEVGLPTKTWVSQSFNALIEAMQADKIDVSFVGGGQYVAAQEPMRRALENMHPAVFKRQTAAILIPHR